MKLSLGVRGGEAQAGWVLPSWARPGCRDLLWPGAWPSLHGSCQCLGCCLLESSLPSQMLAQAALLLRNRRRLCGVEQGRSERV